MGKAQERGDMCILISDSHCCTAENNTTLESNYPPIKKERKEGREGGRQEGEKKRKKCWFHPRSMKIRNLEQAIRVNVA